MTRRELTSGETACRLKVGSALTTDDLCEETNRQSVFYRILMTTFPFARPVST